MERVFELYLVRVSYSAQFEYGTVYNTPLHHVQATTIRVAGYLLISSREVSILVHDEFEARKIHQYSENDISQTTFTEITTWKEAIMSIHILRLHPKIRL